jgi:hypothetical protein
MNRPSLVAILGVAFLLIAQTLEAKEPLEGTWVLNPEKSTFAQVPGPKGQMRRYSMSDGMEKMTARGISSDGQATWVEYAARYDGKDYGIVGSKGGDRISLRRIDALTTESTEKHAGKVTIIALRRVSPDGRTLTVETKGTLPDGRVLNATMVFERR